MINPIRFLLLVGLIGSCYSFLRCLPLKVECDCIPGIKVRYDCKPVKILISITENKTINITCKLDRFDASFFPDLTIGNPNELFINNCKLSANTLENVVDLVRDEKIKIISLSRMLTKNFINQNSFKDLKYLEGINLYQNKFLDLDENVFDGAEKIKRLRIIGHNITLKSKIFEKLSSLRLLNLGLNRIKEIPDGIFENLRNLQSLYLFGNSISKLKSSTFSGLKNLKVLDLSKNLIKSLRKDTFSTLPKLEKIYLSQNELENLPHNLFLNNRNLKEIRIRQNRAELIIPDHLFEKLQRLETVDLGKSGIRKLPNHIFQNLENLREINLEHNQLKALPTGGFQNLKTLANFNLQSNKFAKIELHHFQVREGQSYTVHLENNLITEISNRKEKSIGNAKYVLIFKNQTNIVWGCSNTNISRCTDTEKMVLKEQNLILRIFGENSMNFRMNGAQKVTFKIIYLLFIYLWITSDINLII